MKDNNIYQTSDKKWYWRDEVGEPSDEHDSINDAQQELDEYYTKLQEEREVMFGKEQHPQGLKCDVLREASDNWKKRQQQQSVKLMVEPFKLTITETVTCTIIALATLVFVGALIVRLLEVVS